MCGPSAEAYQRAEEAENPSPWEYLIRGNQFNVYDEMVSQYPEQEKALLNELGYSLTDSGEIVKTSTANLEDKLYNQYLNRQSDYMSGNIGVSPSVEKDLQDELDLLSENLSRKGITEGSTPWIKAMDSYERRASDTREEDRRNSLSTMEDLLSSAKSRESSDYAGLFNYSTSGPGYSLLNSGNTIQEPYEYDRGVKEELAVNEASQQTNMQSNLWGGSCCFIFIASHGFLHPIVRQYRDEHMTVRNRRGYYWLSDRLVPLMKKHKIIYNAVKYLMVDPMTSYGKYYYGLGHIGAIFAPLTQAWLTVFNLLGFRKPYTRKGTGEVV